jgi:hypothetical protein
MRPRLRWRLLRRRALGSLRVRLLLRLRLLRVLLPMAVRAQPALSHASRAHVRGGPLCEQSGEAVAAVPAEDSGHAACSRSGETGVRAEAGVCADSVAAAAALAAALHSTDSTAADVRHTLGGLLDLTRRPNGAAALERENRCHACSCALRCACSPRRADAPRRGYPPARSQRCGGGGLATLGRRRRGGAGLISVPRSCIIRLYNYQRDRPTPVLRCCRFNLFSRQLNQYLQLQTLVCCSNRVRSARHKRMREFPTTARSRET